MKTEIKALIIDDEKEICSLLSGILRKTGIETLSVSSLSEARLVLKTYEPSIVFLDNHLPDGLGIEFAVFVKQSHPDTRVVIITGKETDEKKALLNGASEIIFKPFTSERIFSVIKRIA